MLIPNLDVRKGGNRALGDRSPQFVSFLSSAVRVPDAKLLQTVVALLAQLANHVQDHSPVFLSCLKASDCDTFEEGCLREDLVEGPLLQLFFIVKADN